VGKEQDCDNCNNDEHKIILKDISYELRTPLMSIKSHAEGIKQGIMDAESAA
jgi:signal transduction histidine kinase